MYGVYGYNGWCERFCYAVESSWDEAYKAWKELDDPDCIIDMDTGEVLWD